MTSPPAPADVAVRDTICAFLRDHPIYMDAEEIAHQLAAHNRTVLTAAEVWAHCQALHLAGYLHKTQALPVTWAFIPACMASTHRRIELDEQREFAALAQLAGEKGPTR